MLCAFCSNIAGENTYTKTPVSEELLIMRDKYPNIKEMARNYRDYEEDEYNPKEYYKLKLLITLNGKEYVTDDVQIYLRENDKKQGIEWSKEDDEQFKKPIVSKYEKESSSYYSTARLWDDGIIDPADTRQVLGLALSASMNAHLPDTKFGVFRM
jgi:hypothetical protein